MANCSQSNSAESEIVVRWFLPEASNADNRGNQDLSNELISA
jgi:hypothetical protein